MLWNTNKDLLILIGGKTAQNVARTVSELGQRRIVVYSKGSTPKELHEAISRLPGSEPDQAIVLRVDETISAAETAMIQAQAERSLGALTAYHTTIDAMGPLWLRQGLENMKQVARLPYAPSIPNAKGLPAIVVSLGPSLDKNAHLLKEAKGKTIIVACSHALEALAKVDVIPDVVVILDAQDVRYHLRRGLEGVRIVAVSPTVHPSLLEHATHWFATMNEFDAWLANGEIVQTGGTVGGACLGLAAAWGSSPIMLVGQDYAFEEGRVYSSLSDDSDLRACGTPMGKLEWEHASAEQASLDKIKRVEESVHVVEGYYGKDVFTSATFLQALRWCENFIAEKNIDVWNCTEGGAMIHGARNVALKDAIEGWGRLDVDRALNGAKLLNGTTKRITTLGNDLEECSRIASALLDSEERNERTRMRFCELTTRLNWFFRLGAQAKLVALEDKMLSSNKDEQTAITRELWTLLRDTASLGR